MTHYITTTGELAKVFEQAPDGSFVGWLASSRREGPFCLPYAWTATGADMHPGAISTDLARHATPAEIANGTAALVRRDPITGTPLPP